jgi:hypothetical protein
MHTALSLAAATSLAASAIASAFTWKATRGPRARSSSGKQVASRGAPRAANSSPARTTGPSGGSPAQTRRQHQS